MKILAITSLHRMLPQAYFETLCGPDDQLIFSTTQDPLEMRQLLADADVLVMAWNRTYVPHSSMTPRLKLIQKMSAAFDDIDVAGAKALGIPVANNGGANANSVAEHAMALLLAYSRQLPRSFQMMHGGLWDVEDLYLGGLGEIQGKILGLIGYGEMGKAIARKAEAFGMQIRVRRRTGSPSLEDVLRQSDFVSVQVPLNDSTRGLIREPQLALLKPGAVLMNLARGPVIDTGALIQALDSGQVAAALLDVFDIEPLPGDHPLRRHPKVIATPHTAGISQDAYLRIRERVKANIERVRQGLSPLYQVNA